MIHQTALAVFVTRPSAQFLPDEVSKTKSEEPFYTHLLPRDLDLSLLLGTPKRSPVCYECKMTDQIGT